uniref:fimbria major subunit n=1 Tax=Alloprevotella sp. TaxID=1872471 RepID=UPI003FEDC0A7
MKLNKFLLSAIAAASLTACSDSPDVVKNDKGHWNADGTGYVSLSISMPDNVGSKGSRANNVDLVKGDDKEYAVKNATLVIFSGDTDDEASMTFEAAYDLPLSFTTVGVDGDQIISKGKLTKQINKITKSYAKALVILNKPSNLHLDGNKLTYDVTTTGATGSPSTTKKNFNGKFNDFQKLQSALNIDVTKGFTMTNAPLTKGKSSAAAAPTTGATTTLATINKDNIKPTVEEAEQYTAATIYVERSVAKVTVTKSSTASDKIEGTTNIKYSIEGFDLDNTNTTSYIVRNANETSSWYNLKSKSTSVNGEDQYRFIGVSYVDGTSVEDKSLYRTYWAKDPNYDNTTTAINSSTSTDDKRFSAAPQYCMENTFDVAHQTQVNTTRAILRVQMYKDGETAGTTYYMYNNDVNTFDSETDFNTNAVTTANKLTAVLAGGKKVASIALEDAKDESGNTIAGYKQIGSVTFTGETSSTNTGEAFEAIKNYFGKITVYTKGYAYYPVLIKHFGDQLTPWNTDEYGTTKPSAGGIDLIYPTTNRDANYLGRYGVVRNNWYELKINNVKRPGKSAINTPKDTPDDELESYISVSINILSWAKRSQDVDLQ